MLVACGSADEDEDEAVDVLEVEPRGPGRSGGAAPVLLNIPLLAAVLGDAVFPTFLFPSGSSPPPSTLWRSTCSTPTPTANLLFLLDFWHSSQILSSTLTTAP